MKRETMAEDTKSRFLYSRIHHPCLEAAVEALKIQRTTEIINNKLKAYRLKKIRPPTILLSQYPNKRKIISKILLFLLLELEDVIDPQEDGFIIICFNSG